MSAPGLHDDDPTEPDLDPVEVDGDLAGAVDRAIRDGSRTVVMRSGSPLAEIVPVSEETRERIRREAAGRLRALLDEIAQQFADVDPEEHEREVQRAIDETRAEMRAEAEARWQRTRE